MASEDPRAKARERRNDQLKDQQKKLRAIIADKQKAAKAAGADFFYGDYDANLPGFRRFSMREGDKGAQIGAVTGTTLAKAAERMEYMTAAFVARREAAVVAVEQKVTDIRKANDDAQAAALAALKPTKTAPVKEEVV